MRAFLRSFRAKFFGCFLVVLTLSLAFPIWYIRPVLHEALLQEAYDRLAQEAVLVDALLQAQQGAAENTAALAAIAHTDIRFTLLDAKGVVLMESHQQEGNVPDNHADRPEVIEALQHGKGFTTRFSSTVQQELVYAAFTLQNNTILRLATPFSGVQQRIAQQLQNLPLAAGGLVLLSLLLAWFFSKRLEQSLSGMVRIIEGIAQGRFHRRLHQVPGKEFTPLAYAVNSMAQSLENFIATETDQKAQLNAILDTMAEGVLVLGPRGHIRRVNKAFMATFPSAKKMEGAQVIEVVPCPELQDAVTALLHNPDGHGQSLSLQIRPRGNTIFFVMLARPESKDAQSLGLVAVFHDITELARLETIRRDFVANVSHEMRTPLTAIQGYAETLMDIQEMPEEGQRFAAIIHKHSQFISSMVNELLVLSRVENGSLRLEKQRIDPKDALSAASQMLNARLVEKNLTIEEHFTQGLLVYADARQLEQVLRNLLENACRYAPQGSTILVSAQLQKQEVLFCVADQGCGIPPADKDRIFERFYRVEKHRGGGNGLGLAICKHIIDRHQGHMWVESPTPSAATAFYFTLPQGA